MKTNDNYSDDNRIIIRYIQIERTRSRTVHAVAVTVSVHELGATLAIIAPTLAQFWGAFHLRGVGTLWGNKGMCDI